MPVPQIDVNLWICVVICCIMKEKGERNAGMGDSAYNVLGLPDLELVSCIIPYQHNIRGIYHKFSPQVLQRPAGFVII